MDAKRKGFADVEITSARVLKKLPPNNQEIKDVVWLEDDAATEPLFVIFTTQSTPGLFMRIYHTGTAYLTFFFARLCRICKKCTTYKDNTP